MDKDYQNFIERMGSFEDEIDLSEGLEHTDKIITRNGELTHFGIKGMKWGHHKAITSNVVGAAARTGQSATALGQTLNRSGYNSKTLKKAKTLSDDELKTLTNRLNLENNYINATTQQTGKGKVDSILSTAGATLALVSTAAVMVDAIRKVKV